MKVDGGCRCGQINLAAEVASGAIGDCIDGQPRSGFAFRTVVPTKAVALRLLAGEPRLYVALGAVRSVLCQPASSYEPADRQRSLRLQVLNVARHTRTRFGIGQPAVQRGHVVLHMLHAPGGGDGTGDGRV